MCSLVGHGVQGCQARNQMGQQDSSLPVPLPLVSCFLLPPSYKPPSCSISNFYLSLNRNDYRTQWLMFTWDQLDSTYRLKLPFKWCVNFPISSYNFKSRWSSFKGKYNCGLQKFLLPIVSKVFYSVDSRLRSVWNMPFYCHIAQAQ